MCIQIAHAAVYQFLILLRSIGVPEPMEGQRMALVGILDGSPIRHDEKLKTVDGPIRGHIIRHQQLVSARRAEDGETVVVNRGDKGAAIINFAAEENEVTLPTYLPEGEYTDKVYGQAFKVEDGILYGKVKAETTYIL